MLQNLYIHAKLSLNCGVVLLSVITLPYFTFAPARPLVVTGLVFPTLHAHLASLTSAKDR